MLKAEYHVGATMVRRAEAQLAAQGLLHIEHGVGARVVATEPADELDPIAALVQARDLLERVLHEGELPRRLDGAGPGHTGGPEAAGGDPRLASFSDEDLSAEQARRLAAQQRPTSR